MLVKEEIACNELIKALMNLNHRIKAIDKKNNNILIPIPKFKIK